MMKPASSLITLILALLPVVAAFPGAIA